MESQPPNLIRLWLLWVIATTVSSGAGWVVINALVAQNVNAEGAEIALTDDNALGPLLLFGCGLLLLVAPAIGIAQGLVLRYALKFRFWILWTIATFFGVILTLILGVMLGEATGGSAAGYTWALVPGGMLGATQWFVLQNNMKIKSSGLWLVGCMVGWILGVVVAILVHDMLYSTKEEDYNLPYYPTQAEVAWSVAWTLGSLLFSAITGATLVWLVRTSSLQTVTQ